MGEYPLSTPPTAQPALTLPLSPELRAAYEDLYDEYETAIENTIDVGALEALNASQLDVGNILTKDDEYRLAANTALYDALLLQINSTNADLKALRQQMLAIANDISTFSDILAAIDKILSMVPGA
jgi:hypothetical protein